MEEKMVSTSPKISFPYQEQASPYRNIFKKLDSA